MKVWLIQLLLTTFIRIAAMREIKLFGAMASSWQTPPLDKKSMPWIRQRVRPRRNRYSSSIRDLVRENHVRASDLIYPLFIKEGSGSEPISSMPGVCRHGIDSVLKEIEEATRFGVRGIILFPLIAHSLKTNMAEESANPNGLVPRVIRALREQFPELVICTDVALDPYSDQGHDGVVVNGKIVNDLTIVQLQKQAVMQAAAGASIVAPSDMMDGRIGAIRDALDEEGYSDVGIMAYTAKYASSFYGPFRDALHSHPGFGDKKTYQQDPANGREALIEASLDAAEGADVLMVKPGLPYLDVVHRLRQQSNLPIAAYHVSGEFSMIKAAAEKGWISEKAVVMESMLAFKRAGADIVLTYFAKDVAKWILEDESNL